MSLKSFRVAGLSVLAVCAAVDLALVVRGVGETLAPGGRTAPTLAALAHVLAFAGSFVFVLALAGFGLRVWASVTRRRRPQAAPWPSKYAVWAATPRRGRAFTAVRTRAKARRDSSGGRS